MTKFSKEERPVRDKMVSIRMTQEQWETLSGVAEELQVEGVADAIRNAVDFYLENNTKAKRALSKVNNSRR